MKKTKTMMAFFAAALLSVASIGAVSATGNVTDSKYRDYAITGTAGYENMTRLNDWRGKWDDSSVYLYVLDSSDKDKWMQVQTCGLDFRSANLYNCTLSTRCKKVKWATVGEGEEVIIYNDIYESGFKYADLRVDHNGSTGSVVTFDFNWSPDTALGRYKNADTSNY